MDFYPERGVSYMQKIDLFERLEAANAQIDVWIDEEEYEEVIHSCEIDKELKANEKDDKSLYEVLETAFSHESCTANKDDEWLSILNHSNCPISAIRNIPPKGDRIELNSPCFDTWSRFFWAKLIRARIQQKGTDCYYRRLDQVVAYLERHLPAVLPVEQSEHDVHKSHVFSNMLAVIYLLEMAASGEGVDQRSFADRARRIIKHKIKDKRVCDFYDLLARYNIGLGYFHEFSYRKAALEFNWIISKLQKKWTKNGSFNRGSGKLGKFIHDRMGRELLYLPAVLYRSEIQLKLQLAYHAQDTFAIHLHAPTEYKEAKSNIIKAEAYQQMGRHDQAWQALWQAYQFSKDNPEDLGCREHVRSFTAKPGKKLANLRGRLQNLVIADHLDNLKESWCELPVGVLNEYLKCLYQFFEKYKLSSENQESNRLGYFEQVAEYIALLSEEADKKSKDLRKNETVFKREAKKIYNKNKNDILIKEADTYSCPCKEKGLDLRRLPEEHYDGFCKNLRKFFGEFVKKDKSLADDQRRFLERLEGLEKTNRESLYWRIRDLKLEREESLPQKWGCTKCLSTRGKPAFGRLLECAPSSSNEKHNDLLAKDYEKIMDHWDEHFLEHMKDPSFHKPRCRSLHFLGLQRWNSTSPAQGRSLGGGYLIYHTDKEGKVDMGVAIDPGFDFVRNLFHVGFGLADIDVVLLSHAHVDHVRDFESMVTLLLELRKRTKNTDKEIKRKLHAIMTLGVYRRLEYLIERPGLREFMEPYILDIEKDIDPKIIYEYSFEFIQENYQSNRSEPSSKPDRPRFVPVLPGEHGEDSSRDNRIYLTIAPTKAYHNDFSEYSDSFGFILTIKAPKAESQPHYTFGYTGDTSWSDDIMKQYKAISEFPNER